MSQSAIRKPKSAIIRVLLIEDNHEDLYLIEEMLAKATDACFDLKPAVQLSAGLKCLTQEKIDVILLDLSPSGIYGLADLDRLHAQAAGVPIVVLGGVNDEALAASALQKGAQDYLVKRQVDSNLLERSIHYAMERQRMLAELEQRTREWQALLYSLDNIIQKNPEGIIIVDRPGVVRFVNPAAESLLRRKSEELIGEMFGFPVTSEKTELDIIHGGREATTVEMHVVEMEWKGEIVYLASLRDITERKQAQEALQKAYRELQESQAQLIQSEKMSGMGTLVAGIAHELNNPMMGILNFSQYCLKHTSEDDRRYPVLQDIQQETQHCIDIVQNLLTFSRMEREDETYQKGSCTVILERVLKLLSCRIGKQSVRVTYHTADGTPEVWMKVNSIQQVFLNLTTNALDALERSEKKEIHVDIRRDGEFVQATIGGTGGGIAPENFQEIFDPFFTKKPAGQGTGLGLSVSRAIIKEHGGEITCESEPGIGTKFRVLLPINRRKEGAK